MSDWQAMIAADWMAMGVSIVWSREISGGREFTDGKTGWISMNDRTGVVNEIEPLRLDDEKARALLAGLLRHYNGADDARMLRKDYDAERARVDRLIGALLPVQP